MRLGLDQPAGRLRVALWGAGAIVVAAALFGAGFALRAVLDDDGGDGPPGVAAPTSTPRAAQPSRTPSRTPPPPATPTRTAAPPVIPAATSPPPPPTATPTPTIDPLVQPAVDVVSIEPPLGFHIELAQIDVTIAVSYQAGRDSNVLGWSLLYCASPNDCNTYGFEHGLEIVPGSSGSATLGATFPAGGNYLRPIVVCQYTVEIGHFITPEVRWQSQLASDERCQGSASGPRITVVDISPPLGTNLGDGQVVAVNVEYVAGPADQILISGYGPGCGVIAAATRDIEPEAAGVATIDFVVSPPATGELRSITAQLLNGGIPIADYTFGAC
jgi:hypothetical protein